MTEREVFMKNVTSYILEKNKDVMTRAWDQVLINGRVMTAHDSEGNLKIVEVDDRLFSLGDDGNFWEHK